jgi:uncharacterized membrane protein
MAELALTAAIAAALLFLFAASMKIRSFSRFQSELSDYDIVPRRLAPIAASLVLALELLGAVATLAPATRVYGALVLFALCIVFTAAVVWNIRRGHTDIRCACFGAASQKLGWAIPVRNLFLALALILGALASEGTEPNVTFAAVIGTALYLALGALMVELARVFESAEEAKA